MKFYINGPADKGEGTYSLIAESGEVVAGHFCSSFGFARGDLTTTFAKRREELEGRFGPFAEHEVIWLGDVPTEESEALRERNHALHEAETGGIASDRD